MLSGFNPASAVDTGPIPWIPRSVVFAQALWLVPPSLGPQKNFTVAGTAPVVVTLPWIVPLLVVTSLASAITVSVNGSKWAPASPYFSCR